MNTSLENVRAKIIEAVPDIKTRKLVESKYGDYDTEDSITLADVLRTLPPFMYLKTMGEQVRLVSSDADPGVIYWDLTCPSLDEQEPEVIEFLERILCAEPLSHGETN